MELELISNSLFDSLESVSEVNDGSINGEEQINSCVSNRANLEMITFVAKEPTNECNEKRGADSS